MRIFAGCQPSIVTSICILLVAILIAATMVGAQTRRDRPGDRHHIRPSDLPPPFHSRSVDNGPTLVSRPSGARPLVPAGFRVDLFYEGTLGGENSPRLMALAPNGDLFAADSGGHRIYVLRDADRNGKAERLFTFASRENGIELPFGLAFHGRYLYVGSTNHVSRFPYASDQTRARGRGEVVVSGLPGFGYRQHWTRNVIFRRDGRKMYVSVGSQGNVGEEEEKRAAILEYNPDGTGYRRFAFGIRNPVGLAFHPTTGRLYTAVNERDGLGDDLVPDYFTSVRAGGFYGWPYSYIGKTLDPRMGGKGKVLAQRAIVPDVLLESHTAALGCVFYTGTMFPRDYRDDAFVAMHGSWNRSRRSGYKVVRIPFRNGRPEGGYDDFMTGFVLDQGNQDVWGRPVGLLVMRDGALLVSDDGGHRIWRVTYRR